MSLTSEERLAWAERRIIALEAVIVRQHEDQRAKDNWHGKCQCPVCSPKESPQPQVLCDSVIAGATAAVKQINEQILAARDPAKAGKLATAAQQRQATIETAYRALHGVNVISTETFTGSLGLENRSRLSDEQLSAVKATLEYAMKFEAELLETATRSLPAAARALKDKPGFFVHQITSHEFVIISSLPGDLKEQDRKTLLNFISSDGMR